MYDSLHVAGVCARAADAKKASDILVLDIRQLTFFADYFVICSGSNTTQVGAIADGIGQALLQDGVHTSHVEGQADSHWVLMDYGDVVVHIFEEQTRAFYCLEKLWGEARRLSIAPAIKTPATALP